MCGPFQTTVCYMGSGLAIYIRVAGLSIFALMIPLILRWPQREEVIEEISNLHPQIKKTLHKIWKSYSLYRKNAEARDKYFWAHEKIVHCWDNAGFLPGENFNTTAKIGDAVRSTLLRWMVKSDIRPNHFYDSVVWREGMHDLYDADVHLVIKKDYGATKLTYLEGMGLLMKVDNTESGVSLIDYPCLVSSSGKFFLLM